MKNLVALVALLTLSAIASGADNWIVISQTVNGELIARDACAQISLVSAAVFLKNRIASSGDNLPEHIFLDEIRAEGPAYTLIFKGIESPLLIQTRVADNRCLVVSVFAQP